MCGWANRLASLSNQVNGVDEKEEEGKNLAYMRSKQLPKYHLLPYLVSFQVEKEVILGLHKLH